MSYPPSHEEAVAPEHTLLPSAVVADQLVKLRVVAKALRGSSDPTHLQHADTVVQHCALLGEELAARGDQALLPQDEEPDYTGKKAIYIEGVTEQPPYPRQSS